MRTNKPEPDGNKNKPPALSEKISQTLQDLWQGKMPLMEVFWLYAVAPLFAMKALGTALGPLGDMFILLELVWAGFMIKPVFIAADRYKGPKHWGLAARIGVIIIGFLVLANAAARIF